MVDRWTNPTTSSLRGEDSRPLQQTFASLSTYLDKLDTAITAAAASGVTSLTAGTGIGLSGGTGVVTVSNTGVTGLTGTANQVTVSAGTGSVTISLPQNIHTGASPTFSGLTSTGNIIALSGGVSGGWVMRPWTANAAYNSISTVNQTGSSYVILSDGGPTFVSSGSGSTTYIRAGANDTSGQVAVRASNVDIAGTLNFGYGRSNNGNSSKILFGPNSSWGAYLNVGSGTSDLAAGTAQVLSTDGNLHLDCGSSQNMYLNYYSGRTISVHGFMSMNGQAIGNAGYIQSGATGVTYSGSVSATNWFRSTGGTGWYNETYAGGIWMSDSTWIRTYNYKNFYCDSEVRVGGLLSGNVGRSRGSYGSISIGGNGITNTWDGIEFNSSAQTFMIQGDYNSGVYRNNNTWNWLFQYSSLLVGSDERYKRDIQPLNAGLNFIELLNPISYLKLTESPDDDPEATEPSYYYGFSAQNVRAALDAIGETRDVQIHDIGGPNMGLIACTEDAVYDRQFIGITEFIAPLVQAVKELNSRVKQLEQGVVHQ